MNQAEYETLTSIGANFMFGNWIFGSDLPSTTLDALLTKYYEQSINYQFGIKGGAGIDAYPAGETVKPPTIKALMLGIGGRYYNNTSQLMLPFNPPPTNVNLYIPIPVKVLTVAMDAMLTDTERLKYRLRQEVVDAQSGDTFVYYWALTLDADPDDLSIKTVPVDINTLPADPTFTNIKDSSYAPASNAEENFTPNASTVQTGLNIPITINGNDIQGVVNHLFGGNLAYGAVSEFGLIMGADYETSFSIDGTTYNMTELHNSYLAYHRCTIGTSMVGADQVYKSNITIADIGGVVTQ